MIYLQLLLLLSFWFIPNYGMDHAYLLKSSHLIKPAQPAAPTQLSLNYSNRVEQRVPYSLPPISLGLNVSYNSNGRGHSICQPSKPVCVTSTSQALRLFENKIATVQTEIQQTGKLLNSISSAMQKNESPVYHIMKSVHAITQNVPKEAALQQYLCRALKDIKAVITNSQGFVKSTMTKSDIKQVNRIIESFNESAINWIRTSGSLEYAHKLSPDYDPHLQAYALSPGETIPSRVFEDLVEYKQIQAVERLCSLGQFSEAQILADTSYSPQHKKLLGEIVSERYSQHYTPQGINKQYLKDPVAQQLTKDLPESTLPSVHNTTLARRDTAKNALLQQCRIGNPSDATLQFAYEVLDQKATGGDSAIEFMCTSLSNDHIDLVNRQTCKDFCSATNHLPKISQYNDEIRKATFPEKMGSVHYMQDRVMLARVGKLDTRISDIKIQVERVIRYAQLGCSGDKNATHYRTLANTLADALVQNNGHPILSFQDFSVSGLSSYHESIKEKVVQFLADGFKTINKNPEQAGRLTDLQIKTNSLYNAMLKGDFKAQVHLEQAFLSGRTTEKILEIDFEGTFQNIKHLPEGCIVERFKHYTQAINEIEKSGIVYSQKSYSIDAKTRLFMLSKGANPLTFTFTGNQLDHVIHGAVLDDFKLGTDIKIKGICDSAKNMFDVATYSNVLVHKCLAARDYVGAIHLSTIAHHGYTYVAQFGQVMGHYTYEAAAGSLQGVGAGLNNVAHLIAHPVDTVTNMASGLLHMADALHQLHYYTSRDMLLVAAIRGPDKLAEYRAGAQEYFTQVHKVTDQILDRISHTGVRDVFREGFQFVTEAAVTGEIVKFVGNACTVVKAQANILRDTKFLQTEKALVATTAESVEVKVGHAAENAMYEQQAGAQNIKTAPEKAISKVETQLTKEPSAQSAIDGLRLRTTLSFQEAGILDAEGKLTQRAIEESRIIDVGVINNEPIVKELIKDGSNIADWKKYTTNSVTMADGERRQIHYYMNKVTGKIDYITKDFKMKGEVCLCLK